MADLNYPDNVDKIVDFITRPREEIKDIDGKGHYSISPLSFPNVNVSGDTNPTLITPNFSATYKDAKNEYIPNTLAQFGTLNTITLNSLDVNTDNFYKGGIIKITSGTGFDQYRIIINYVSSTKIATVDYDWVIIPDSTSSYSILINREQEEIGSVIRENFSQIGSLNNNIILDPGASLIDDFYNTNTIKIIHGTGSGQVSNIISYTASIRQADILPNWVIPPDSDSVFIILIRENMVQSASLSDVTLDSGSSQVIGAYNGFIVRIIEGLGAGQERLIIDYSGLGNVATIDRDWITIPNATSKFIILKNIKYIWDGTENDNKVGIYPNDPITGKEITHLRKTYSDTEVANYLKITLDPALRMGRNGDGTLFKWLTGRGSENIGSGPSGNSIIVEGFGAVPVTDIPNITIEEVAKNKKEKRLEILKKRRELRRHKRHTNWLIPNQHSFNTYKSVILKDYPNIYNSEYIPERIGTLAGATHTLVTLDVGANATDGFYVNMVIEITSGPGKGQSATVTFYTGALRLAVLSEYWEDLPDATSKFKITKIQDGANSPNIDNYRVSVNGSITPNLRPFMVDAQFYQLDNSFHNNITLNLNDNTMYGRHHISMLHNFDRYSETDGSSTFHPFTDKKLIVDQLNLIDSRIIRQDTDGPVIRYLFKRRLKGSITAFVLSLPSSTEVEYQLNYPNPGNITIHLDPGTNNLDVTFTGLTLPDLISNNTIIPGIIDPLELSYNLETLYVHNTIIDLADPDNIYRQSKMRSKKTFVHLPTSGVDDGAICELDVSLPQQKTSNDWFHNTIGVLSGFKNYITQPRVYVFSGYNLKVGNDCNLAVDLTEKKNPYLFSTQPEAEYASTGDGNSLTEIIDENGANDIYDENSAGNDIFDENDSADDIVEPEGANIFHQRKMEKFDIFGNRFIRKMTFISAGYITPIDSDKGKTILGTPSGNRAILLNFNTLSRTWIIRLLDSGEFNTSEVITIIGGSSATGTTSSALFIPKFQDKRVLIATVYPNATNTFGWRMDNDPSLRLMHWSILANSQFEDSATYKAYKRNKKVIEDITSTYPLYAANFDFSVRDFSLSYKNNFISIPDTNFNQYISTNIRLLYPPKLIPETSSDFISDTNLTYALHGNQCNKAFNELLHDFYKGRVRLDVRSDMATLDSEDLYIGFKSGLNTNSTRISPVLVSENYSSTGFIQFNNTVLPYNGNDNIQRWMTKPKDLPLYIVDPSSNTEELSRNVFEPPSNDFFTYLSDYFVDAITSPFDKAWVTEADNRYIIGSDLYPKPSIFRDFAFGSGPIDDTNPSGSENDHNHIIRRIKNSNTIPTGMVEDTRRRLWESSFDIPYGDDSHPGHNRKFNLFDFRSDLPNDDKYFSKFYGMLWSPFSRIFDMSSTIPKEHSIDGIENLTTITGNGAYDPVQRTLINYVKSNPIAERYYRLNFQTSDGAGVILDSNNRELSMISGIHDKLTDLPNPIVIPDFFNTHKDTFMRNYVSPHSNLLANRFYNSYRMILTGDAASTAIENVEHFDTTRTFKTMAFSYLNNIVTTPDATAIDDDYLLKLPSLPAAPVKAEDFNMSWTFFDSGKGKHSGLAGVGTNTNNTLILDTGASIIFDYYKDNIIHITSGPLSGTYRTITSYDNFYKIVTVDSDWDETNPLNVPLSGNAFTINTQISALINTSGEQFVFRKGFYDAKGDRSYIRMKMKFIYSSKMGRWVTLDYRQTATSYLTPTFGNVALSKKENTIVFPGKNGNLKEDYIPFIIPDGTGTINTITSIVKPYPWNPNTNSQYKDFLWQNDNKICQTQTPETTPYHKMKPMKLNRFCIPFLSNKLPYDNNGILASVLSGEHDFDYTIPVATEVSTLQFEDYTEPVPYTVSAIHITENGIGINRDIWISTNGPINSGVKRKTGGPVVNNYTPTIDLQTVDPLARKDATGIDSDSLGNIYFAAKKLITCDPSGTTFTVVTGVANLVTPPLNCINLYVDKSNNLIFVVGTDGFFVFDITLNKWTRKLDSSNSILHFSGANSVHRAPDGTVWIVSLNAGDLIYRYVYGVIDAPLTDLTSELTVYGTKHQQVKNSVRVALNGDVFVSGNIQGTYATFSRRDYTSGTWVVNDLPLDINPFNIRIDGSQDVWISATGGLVKFVSDGIYNILNTTNGLDFSGVNGPNDSVVLSLDIDSLNNIWVGGIDGILYYRRFIIYNHGDYTLNKLLQPNKLEANGGIDFIVPNNVTGGKVDPDDSLFLFQPHMFKVYWHIRPVVSAYKGTDIPFSRISTIYTGYILISNTINTLTLDAGASGTSGFYINNVIFISSGPGMGQYRKIINYSGPGNLVTIDRDWDILPAGSDSFVIINNGRLGGQISDPCLANMFNFPKLSTSNPELGAFNNYFRIPWHSNMALNWLDDGDNLPSLPYATPIEILQARLDDVIDENDADDTDIIIDENDLTCVDNDDIIIEP